MSDLSQSPTLWSHVLVPVDLSDGSRTALKQGLQLARAMPGTQLTAMVVVERHQSGLRIQTDDLHEKMHLEAEQTLAGWISELAGGLEVESCVVEGSPGPKICEEADARKVDLIVVGSHGRTGLKRYLLGSVAEKVIRLAHCTVLVVR